MSDQKPLLDPAMGDLGKFPAEIIFKILDNLLGSSPRLTHENFHSIKQLMKTSKAVEECIKFEWVSSTAPNSLKQRMNAVVWYSNSDVAKAALGLQGLEPDAFPILDPHTLGPDLITEILHDDCHDCFEWFAEIVPGTHMECCNECGRTFKSLSIDAKLGKFGQQALPTDLYDYNDSYFGF
ncbi:hypothetical protein N7463_006166 [Penicillium fimorum]|uniref:Uncharacterized protein n=1 Tax=Penicillium fimorum TaxID=1882269 RepID=A0A9W9XTY1_9EURO|nr:hypothetical protein N7463_006166 [Penicillium fimorum]